MNGRQSREGLPLWVEIAAITLILAAGVFGGASRANELRQGIVELAAIPLLVGAVWTLSGQPWDRNRLLAVSLAALVVALPALHLVPLPFEVWRALPGREPLALLAGSAGLEGWRPFSMTPTETRQAISFLAPPLAIFLAGLAASPGQRLRLIGALIVAAAVSALWGAVQAAGGFAEVLRPYGSSHGWLPIGAFANRNHQAMLMASAVALAALWPVVLARSGRAVRPVEIGAGAVILVMFIVAALATQSRAGVLALMAAGLGAIALSASSIERAGGGRSALLVVGGVIILAVGAAAMFGFQALQARFELLGEREGRLEFWPDVIAAAWPLQPLGGGIGSFDTVFRAAEPLDTMNRTFLNHAHNDVLELWLEGGAPGLLIGAAVVLLIGWRSVAAWRAGRRGDPLAKAASLVCLILLAHSVADYPLRTACLAVAFGLCAALVVCPQSARTAGPAAVGQAHRPSRRTRRK